MRLSCIDTGQWSTNGQSIVFYGSLLSYGI